MVFNPYTGRYENVSPTQQNPFAGYTPQYANAYPSEQIIKVNGIDGARALQLGPNSSKIVLDETKDNRLYLCMTDGAGFKTVRPMRCEFEDLPQPSVDNTSADRLAAVEKRLKELEALMNDKFSSGNTRRRGSADDSNGE